MSLTDASWGLSPRHDPNGQPGRPALRDMAFRDASWGLSPGHARHGHVQSCRQARSRTEVAPLRLGSELAQELVEPRREGVSIVHDLVLLALHHLPLTRKELVVREGLDQPRHTFDHPE